MSWKSFCTFSGNICVTQEGTLLCLKMIAQPNGFKLLSEKFQKSTTHGRLRRNGSGIKKNSSVFIYICWKRSLKKCDCKFTGELDPGNQRLLTPSCAWNVCFLVLPRELLSRTHPRETFKSWEAIWAVHVAEPSESLYTKIRWAETEMDWSCSPRQASWGSCLAGGGGLPLPSVPPWSP